MVIDVREVAITVLSVFRIDALHRHDSITFWSDCHEMTHLAKILV
jgi:hypothetical protein